MQFRVVGLAFLVITSCIGRVLKAQPLPYKDANLPVEQRVRDLLGRMNPEEKFYQLFLVAASENPDTTDFRHGIYGLEWAQPMNNNIAEQGMQTNAVTSANEMRDRFNTFQRFLVERTRLGIPAIFVGEALHGLIAKDVTVFPASIALAASFDTLLMQQIAGVISAETRARAIRQVLSPVVNLATDVRWGRTEETYGEDPFLSSCFGESYVKVLEVNGIVTTPKHFVANVGDGGRDSYPINAEQSYLYATHYQPFMACFLRGGSRSVMSSYNSLNGQPCSMNGQLLNTTLKHDWRFKGVVVSDAGAVGGANVLHNTSDSYANSGKQAIENGLDVIFQTSIKHAGLFIEPFVTGKVNQAAFDSAVARVLRLKFELGLFESPYANPSKNEHVEKVRNLAFDAALEGMVLLRNERDALPISPKVKRILVIGSDAVEGRLGGYSGSPEKTVNYLEGIKSLAGKNCSIQYLPGPPREENDYEVIPSSMLSWNNKPGLLASYHSHPEPSGVAAFQRQEEALNFHHTFMSPGAGIDKDFYAVTYETLFNPDREGLVNLGLEGNDGFRMFIDGALMIDQWEKVSYHVKTVPVQLKKGTPLHLKIEFREMSGNGKLKLIWKVRPNWHETENQFQIVEAAMGSDYVLFFAGIEEGEFRDRMKLGLTKDAENLIAELHSTGKKVVVVLTGGSAITMPWLEYADAVISTWYGGQEQGRALASILFGENSPSGKLPITFPVHEGQLPLSYFHTPTGRGDDYVNGSGVPLFPFGYGLTYSKFVFENLKCKDTVLNETSNSVMEFSLENTGKRTATEVVQLYLRRPFSKTVQPVLSLKGFQRVTLAPGEKRVLKFVVKGEMLMVYNQDGKQQWEPGTCEFLIGSGSRQLFLKKKFVCR